ncbi:hypothetical protein BD289DRAFT_509559 [Coniella lustricola]|uniref:Protein sip5 n=1 Tax=Coniella lustricola TaxID=2025994 RepID=A0A2T2ZUD2_9PEZI|nr:hypothetical protein BD289DRAFT_509559 [Coniella lustricola]
MGNTPAKESRQGDAGGPSGHRSHRTSLAPALDPSASSSSRHHQSSRTRNRTSRNDLGSLLGITHSNNSRTETSHERRETRAEREARRLERERVNRIKDRERSIREESVDGGFLVTMGVYVGTEDFSKENVRHLQIERKLAPFWRGLNDFSESWTEHQIIAAARGLPIPPADQPPPAELIPRPASHHASPTASSPNLNNLTVPMGPRTLSAASDRSGSNIGSASPLPISGPSAGKGSTSPFKPRTKALAAALSLGSSRNGSGNELTPREINLPSDPFVNGQALEVFLYKEGAECPICFLYYPPYLNHTRCCDQPICSECFVQIKRPDPHFPDSHENGDNQEASPEAAEMLISEPATCPYCQQPELGVTYDPPPFRRGLTYTLSSSVGQLGTAMSSNSSLGSTSPSPFASPPPSGAGSGRRRTHSLSANAPNVITTDRVRPDWAAKLAAQRNHLARRAAAATALHTAAFLMSDNNGRSFGGRMSRFSRRNTGDNNAGDSGRAGPSAAGAEAAAASTGPEPAAQSSNPRRSVLVGPRQSHMENLENMMLAEAIRLSLAAEEDRKRKADKEERKEAKKREKEERKAAKAAAKGNPYSGSGHSSASGSTLSLSLSNLGRRRGNSAASNLRVEATTANAMASTGSSSPPKATAPAAAAPATAPAPANTNDKGKGVDRGGPAQTSPESEIGKSNVDALDPAAATLTSSPAPAPSAAPRPIPSPLHSAGPSHLRQMSSASSGSSSASQSQSNSYQNPSYLQSTDPRSSGISLSGKSDNSDEAGGRSGDENETEPNYNFSSLAQMVGVELEGINAGRRLSQIGENRVEEENAVAADKRGSLHEQSEHVEDVLLTAQSDARGVDGQHQSEGVVDTKGEDEDLAQSVATITQDAGNSTAPQHPKVQVEGREKEEEPLGGNADTPQLVVTPGTPMMGDGEAADCKRLGFQGTQTVDVAGEQPQAIAQ